MLRFCVREMEALAEPESRGLLSRVPLLGELRGLGWLWGAGGLASTSLPWRRPPVCGFVGPDTSRGERAGVTGH